MIFKRVTKFGSPSLIGKNNYHYSAFDLIKQLISINEVPSIDQPYVCTNPTFKNARPRNDWMKRIKDDTLVSMLSIPGTHDSGTYSRPKLNTDSTVTDFFVNRFHITQAQGINKTQSLNIERQLQAGIRYFDLRVNKNYKIHHGPYEYQAAATVLQKIREFLRKNISEFVVLGFQCDNEVEPKQLKSLIGDFGFLSPQLLPVTRLRGKAWVLNGSGINFGSTFAMDGGRWGITDDESLPYYLQNFWNMSNVKGCGDVGFKEKSEKVKQTAFLNIDRSKKMKFNFLSGSVSENNKISAFADGYLPYKIAQSKDGPNYCLNQALKDSVNARAPLGITIMDFPGDELIGQIINTNEQQP